MAAQSTKIVEWEVSGQKRTFLVTNAAYIIEHYKRLTSKGVKLVIITTENELYEGLQLEREGKWYEIFMWDWINDRYYLMRLED